MHSQKSNDLSIINHFLVNLAILVRMALDDGLHLANYAAVNFNKKIAEFHNKKSAPSADDREDEIQRKFWKKFVKIRIQFHDKNSKEKSNFQITANFFGKFLNKIFEN